VEKRELLLFVTVNVRVWLSSGSPSSRFVAKFSIVCGPVSSLTFWFPPIENVGGSLTAKTVNVALSLSDNDPGSVAVKVIVALPFQSSSGIPMVAIPLIIDTVRLPCPE